MKAESNIKPNQIEIKSRDNMCKVLLRKNISEKIIENEGGNTDTLYEYDEVKVNIADRNNLKSYIENNFDMIFQGGLDKENTPPEPTEKERIEALEEAVIESVGI